MRREIIITPVEMVEELNGIIKNVIGCGVVEESLRVDVATRAAEAGKEEKALPGKNQLATLEFTNRKNQEVE